MVYASTLSRSRSLTDICTDFAKRLALVDHEFSETAEQLATVYGIGERLWYLVCLFFGFFALLDGVIYFFAGYVYSIFQTPRDSHFNDKKG